MPSGKESVTMVALLRGINVGKAKRIAMADLRQLVEALGYSNVRTLLNSGNVVFSGVAAAPDNTAQGIESAIAERLGVSSRVTVITADEIAQAVQRNPLARQAADHSKLLVVVPANASLLELVRPLADQPWAPEMLAAGPRFAWVWSPNGVLESKALAALSRVLKDAVTVRNLATMIKLDALCRSAPPG